MKILLEAPILTQSGYGEHSRLVFQALDELDGVRIFVNPLNWGKTGWTSSFDPKIKSNVSSAIESFKKESEINKKTKQDPSYDIHIHVGILNEFTKKAPYSVCVTAGIETDRVSPDWLMRTWKGLNKIIVPSEHAKRGFVQTQYVIEGNKGEKQTLMLNPSVPVEVVSYPVKKVKEKTLDFETSTSFNFLSVSLLGPRKNIENMIRWFVEEFTDEDVGLIIKTGKSCGSLMDRMWTQDYFKRLLAPYQNRKCKVYLLHGDLEEEEVHSLYLRDDVKAYVNLAHGEGFGLPLFEAAYSGLPVIAPDWSGHLDFLEAPYKEGGKVKNKKLFAKVDFDLAAIPDHVVWKDVIIEQSQWAYPKETSYKRQLREVYKNYGMYKKWAEHLEEHINEKCEKEKVLKSLRLALVGEGLGTKVKTKENQDWIQENAEIRVI